ncbi:RING-variant domain protein (macronuclear) [Tetrahymena thermophila SB210]|uniref:RING-variant domain protein n=1 Tax=Tetrahymena thermophila (strain SB210) TaxID=312017 RepID=W7XJW2_TETTS|nr:RING-variant domain protein [Tetrahymena thermophila SB210]EWS74379.1 RING-variant domain protein [Tetrahymena thermophila SB210]|eukprot:XP_012653056.1 RING-variant domain protein [Tetrahymena thermophila SB210]
MKAVSQNIEEDQQQKICRICFCEGSLFNKFIYPCNCKGSVKYIHENCLKTYLISKNPQQQNSIMRKSTNKQKCDLCKIEFQVQWNRKYQIKTCYEIFQSEKLALFFLLCALALLGITIYILVKVRSDLEDKVEGVAKDVVSIMFLILCIFSFIFVFTCSSYLILKSFFKRQISISQIKKLQQ